MPGTSCPATTAASPRRYAVSFARAFSRASTSPAAAVGTVVALGFAASALVAARTVFGGGWAITIVKAVGVGVVYMLASLPVFAVILVWATLA
jgi:hypothetical protein